MRYCTSSRAKAAYQDDIHHARAYLTGPKHDREMWLDDLRAAAVFRRSALTWYRRYRRALEKEAANV